MQDFANGDVLDQYKDENLTDHNDPETAEFLLRVPADQRQNVMAEFARRVTGVKTHYNAFSKRYEHTAETVDYRSITEVMADVMTENNW